MLAVKVEQLLTDPAAGLGLTLLGGRVGLERSITAPRIQKPGLALVGFIDRLHRERVHVLGGTELAFVETLAPGERLRGLTALVQLHPACIVLTRGLAPPPELVELCEAEGVALFVSSLMSSVFIERVSKWLQDRLAARTSVHGVLMDVLGIGVLLLGKSGIGKSEAALDLVMRGHRLVADDIVDVRKKPPDTIFGAAGSQMIKHHMEIRGLGIINVKDLFGIAAVRDTKKIQLVIELVDWREDEEYERIGTDDLHYRILDVDLPHSRVPVRPGRNMTSIIEVAARNQLLKLQGVHSARAFQDRLNRALIEGRKGREYGGDEVE